MKALPKRKGNGGVAAGEHFERGGLNESPSEKEGKWCVEHVEEVINAASMKALPKRKGNHLKISCHPMQWRASMKALPKRKGNAAALSARVNSVVGLNESPSEKEGKFRQ